MSDPNSTTCGICFDEYNAVILGAAPKDRHPSGVCRHSMCLQCAIQHVVASNNKFCPFCRKEESFTDDFVAVLESGETTVSPELLGILQAAKEERTKNAREDRVVRVAMIGGDFSRFLEHAGQELGVTGPELFAFMAQAGFVAVVRSDERANVSENERDGEEETGSEVPHQDLTTL